MLRVAFAALALLASPARAIDPHLANAPKAWRLKPASEERTLILWDDCDSAGLVGRWRGTIRCGIEQAYVFEGFVYQTQNDQEGLKVDSWVGETWAVRAPVGLKGRLSKGKDGVSFDGTLRIVSPETLQTKAAGLLTTSGAYGADVGFKVTADFSARKGDSAEGDLRVTGKKGRMQITGTFLEHADRCLIIADRLFARPVRGCASNR